MKKLLTFSLVFLSVALFSQRYVFDNQCEILEKQIKGIYPNLPPRKILYFYNSNDSNFIAYNFRPNEIHLYDYKLNSLKNLQIKNDEKKIIFNLISESNFRNFPDEILIKKISIENLADDLFLIKTFPSEKSKKFNLEIKIKLKKSIYPLIRMHFMDLTVSIHDLIYNKLLEQLPNKNYQIESIYLDYRNGVIVEEKVSNCKPINLKFDLNFSEKK